MDQQDERLPRLYQMEEFRQQNIPKFQVQGHEYKLSIDLHQQNQPYTVLLQTLHHVLQGEIFLSHTSSQTIEIVNVEFMQTQLHFKRTYFLNDSREAEIKGCNIRIM